MKQTLLFLFPIFALLVACETPKAKVEPIQKTITARRVRLDVKQKDKNVVLSGDLLELDMETLEMKLQGNAKVTMDEPISLRADAAKITLKGSGDVVELSGNVRAKVGPWIQEEGQPRGVAPTDNDKTTDP